MDKVTPTILTEIQGIDFGCEFVDNECVAMRKREANRTYRTKGTGKICCRSCAHNTGFLKIKASELPAEYLPYWDVDLGFWRENVGCNLPKEMRSRRCNIYVCKDSNASDSDRAILLNLEATT